ncbi:hypothetical protein HFO42_06615 [Rhizobium leguminosarum]|uniref:Uncharacterized protein n=1 Tax=Rhizobium leguminosarum TaxID=384 RepID=A0AAJ1ECQ3_RHILE|nr:hypothetical protein [Rhizobium leguminosarum]MBY5614247.1 hypothetical protein [Rhizobium leguminosarum]MBY5627791.1 hypothetical protein [Rhizobium leguminosarum]
MEKLPLLVHGKAITDQGGEDNVGMEHRLRFFSILSLLWALAADFLHAHQSVDFRASTICWVGEATSPVPLASLDFPEESLGETTMRTGCLYPSSPKMTV